MFFFSSPSPAPCGGSFSSNQGEITSPNWPNDYQAQSVCTWRITIPSAKSVHVAFTHFELQAVNMLGKCIDYVEVFNGETMKSLGWLLYNKVSISCTDQCYQYQCIMIFLSVLQVSSAALPLHPLSPSRATQSSSAFSVTETINRKVFVVTGPLIPIFSQLYLLHLLTRGTRSLSVSVGRAQTQPYLCDLMWRFHLLNEGCSSCDLE